MQKFAGAEYNLVDNDGDGDVDKVVVVLTYLGKVTGVNDATETAKRSVNVTVYNKPNNARVQNHDVKVETEKFAKGNYIAIVPAGNHDISGTIETLYMELAESKTGKVSETGTGYLIMNGEKLYTSFTGKNEVPPNWYSDVKCYLDSNGFVIGIFNIGNSIKSGMYMGTGSAHGYGPNMTVKVAGIPTDLYATKENGGEDAKPGDLLILTEENGVCKYKQAWTAKDGKDILRGGRVTKVGTDSVSVDVNGTIYKIKTSGTPMAWERFKKDGAWDLKKIDLTKGMTDIFVVLDPNDGEYIAIDIYRVPST